MGHSPKDHKESDTTKYSFSLSLCLPISPSLLGFFVCCCCLLMFFIKPLSSVAVKFLYIYIKIVFIIYILENV